MRTRKASVFLVSAAVLLWSCTPDSDAGSSTTALGASRTQTAPTTIATESVAAALVPIVAPTRTGPVAGRWVKTNLGLDGLLVMGRDLIWDGEAFYLMQRVAFGDMRIWRSIDGVAWEELPSVGTFAMVDGGPEVLLSDAGLLVAGGRRGDQATVWVYGGESPWTEVALGGEGVIQGIVPVGSTLVAFGTATPVLGPVPERHAKLWVSTDEGASWEETTDQRFGEFSQVVGLVSVGDSAVAVANRSFTGDGDKRVAHTPLVLISRDGTTWEAADLVLEETLVQSVSGGNRITLQTGSGVLQSDGGDTWTKILIDWSGLDTDNARRVTSLDGYLVLTGGVVRPNPRFGEAAYPGAWTYAGNGVWHELGALDQFSEPGVMRAIAFNGERFVADGAQATGGSPDDGWALYTFLPDP